MRLSSLVFSLVVITSGCRLFCKAWETRGGRISTKLELIKAETTSAEEMRLPQASVDASGLLLTRPNSFQVRARVRGRASVRIRLRVRVWIRVRVRVRLLTRPNSFQPHAPLTYIYYYILYAFVWNANGGHEGSP